MISQKEDTDVAKKNAMQEGAEKYGAIKTVGKVLMVFAIVGITGYFICKGFNSSGLSKLKVDLGGMVVDLDIDNGQLGVNQLIKKLFLTDESKVQTLAVLRNNYQLYRIDDPLLADAIKVIKYKQQKDLSESLRDLAILRLGPFEIQEYLVEVRVAHSNGPEIDFAAACRNSFFYDRYITLFDLGRSHSVDVFVNKPMKQCSSEESGVNNIIEISQGKMRELMVGQAGKAGLMIETTQLDTGLSNMDKITNKAIAACDIY